MIFRINNTEDSKKVKNFIDENNIEYEMEQYPFSLMLKDDIEYILEDIDENEDIEDLTEYEKKEIIKYIQEYMWNSYEWSDYNDILRCQRDEKLKELRGE